MNSHSQANCPEGSFVVDADAMQKLTSKYNQYQNLVEREFYDPLTAMRLTGEVLASVREVIVSGAGTAVR